MGTKNNMLGTRLWIAQMPLTVTAMTGIAAILLPFTADISPAIGVLSDVRPLAFPFLLSVLVSAAYVRRSISGSLSRPEQALAYVATAVSVAMTFSFVISGEGWLGRVIPLVTALLGAHFVRSNRKIGQARDLTPVLAMQVAYLVNCSLCLIGFFGEWQIGAVFALVTAVSYCLQITRPGLLLVSGDSPALAHVALQPVTKH